MSVIADNKPKILGRLGSYWGEHVHPDSAGLLRDITRQPELAEVYSEIDRARLELIGHPTYARRNFVETFKPEDVAVLGPDLQKRVTLNYQDIDGVSYTVIRRPEDYDVYDGHVLLGSELNDFLQTENCLYILAPYLGQGTPTRIDDTILQPKYLVPWSYTSKPYAVRNKNRVFVLGIDYRLGYGAMIFRENPIDLFDDFRIHVLAAETQITNPMNYVLGLEDFVGPATEISTFFRETQTPRQLELAVARAAGLTIIPTTGVLREQREECEGVRYLFDWGQLTVPYLHTQLIDGQVYDAGTIVGDGIKVYGTSGRHGWHNEVSWPDEGLSLDNLCPFKGLTVPNQNITLEAYELISGSDYHVRPLIQGDQDTLDRYWGWLKEYELKSGIYLNDLLGLNSLGATLIVSGIDFYFEKLLTDRSIVVDLKLQGVNEQMRSRALSFINEHRMLGSTVIILDR